MISSITKCRHKLSIPKLQWCSQWSLRMLTCEMGTCLFVFLNTLRPRQDGRHFPDDIFICIFLNENVWISLKISLKFVPKVWINNIPTLVQIMAWHRPGDKPLSEPMVINLVTHICITRPQWVKCGSTRINFKKLPKFQILKILQGTLHMTHLLKLLDKMYEYEMDPTRTVDAMERTRDAGWTDGRSETNIPPNNFVVSGV